MQLRRILIASCERMTLNAGNWWA